MKMERQSVISGTVGKFVLTAETEEEASLLSRAIEFRFEIWEQGRGVTFTQMDVPIVKQGKPHKQ